MSQMVLHTGIMNSMKSPSFDEKEGIFSCDFWFDRNFPGFSGHFPGNPVLPAVVQLAAVRILSEKMFQVPLKLKKIERARFKSIVLPEEEISISGTVSKNDDIISVTFSIAKESGDVASGSLLLEPDKPIP